jgi:hypothetical protein
MSEKCPHDRERKYHHRGDPDMTLAVAGGCLRAMIVLRPAAVRVPPSCHAPGARMVGLLRDDERREGPGAISCLNAPETPENRVRRP